MFNPGLWRVRRFSDVMPEIMHLQQEMNRLFSQCRSKDYTGLSCSQYLGKRRCLNCNS